MVGMEAAVVSAVVSSTLKIVGNKLTPLVIKQYRSIDHATEDLKELQVLFEEINYWLQAVGDKAKWNDLSFNWLKQLKDVIHEVDDVVDEVHLDAEKHDADGEGGKNILLKKLCRKPKTFMFRYKAAQKIREIKGRFAALVRQRTEFSAITNSLPISYPVQHINNTTGQMPSLPAFDEALVLGRDQEKHQIISKLVEGDDQQKIKIVSVIGLGGSGKTTFAKLIFGDADVINKHFEVRIWVHVSQEFHVAKLLGKLFEDIAGEKSEHCPLQKMSKTIHGKLTGKRYLLVLDDVWTEDRISWEQFMEHLRIGAHGSRILLTTRSRRVAEAVESADSIDLSFLSEANSWHVFQQSFGTAVKSLDSEFVEVGKAIVNKCGGVPLAIKVLAGVLRVKKRIEEWQAMRRCSLFDVEGEEHIVFECLRLSFIHLASHLKQCFSICALFPKGHVMDKERLIDLWIAHDIITLPDGIDYLEYVGEEFFSSLVQMSFLQDVEEQDGRVICRMHDLLHDLALTVLGDEISLVLPKEVTNSKKRYRYFSLFDESRNLAPKDMFVKARAMYVAKGNDFIFGKALEKARHLRSIIVNFSVMEKSLPSAILRIKNLRFLDISGTNCETLPDAVSDIWSLQALHVANSDHLLELPKSIGKLQKLRTLNLSECPRLKILPDSIGDCHKLSSLDLTECNSLEVLPDSIRDNKNLRVLRLGYTKIKRLPSDIVNLTELNVLNLRGLPELAGMPVGIRQLTKLQNLGAFVVGDGENFAKISELGNINKIGGDLTIRSIAYGMDPNDAKQAYLNQKTNLQSLKLIWKDDRTKAPNVETELGVLNSLEAPAGIKGIEITGYAGQHYACWMLKQVGAGAVGVGRFPWLTTLKLSNFLNLKSLQGLVELPCLQSFELTSMPSLESISGGPFPSLVKLVLESLDMLGEVWMETEQALADAEARGSCSNWSPHLVQLQIGSQLSKLDISGCPKLKIKPYLPLSLEELALSSSNEQLLLSSGQSQGISWSSFDAGLNSYSRLKKLELVDIASPSGSGLECDWDLLQHMTALEYLSIFFCHDLTEMPESMRSLTSLQTLYIKECSALSTLPEWLGVLPSLQHMRIRECHSLSIPVPFVQQLTRHNLEIHLSSDHDLFLDNASDHDLFLDNASDHDQLLELSPQNLWICSCPARGANLVESSPQSLETVRGDEVNQQLPEGLGELCSLQHLNIRGATYSPRSLSQSIGHLTSLQSLEINCCWHALHQLPECLGELRSLRTFEISGFDGLTCLPKSMCRLTSLQVMSISYCLGIKSLPEWIPSLTALQELRIWLCPDLERRCERGKGEDWHLISHIPRQRISWKIVDLYAVSVFGVHQCADSPSSNSSSS